VAGVLYASFQESPPTAYRYTTANPTAVEGSRPAGKAICDYTVPANNRFTAKALTFVVPKRASNPVQSGGANGGLYTFKLNGNDILKTRGVAYAITSGTGFDEMHLPNARQNFSFGDGITLTSSDTISLVYNDQIAAGNAAYNVCMQLVGIENGAPVFHKFNTMVAATFNTDVTYWSYTPAATFTLRALVLGSMPLFGTPYAARVGVAVDGNECIPGVYLGQHIENCVQDGGRALGGYGMGVVTMPLWGMKLSEGQRLGMWYVADKYADCNVAAMIAGDVEAIGASPLLRHPGMAGGVNG